MATCVASLAGARALRRRKRRAQRSMRHQRVTGGGGFVRSARAQAAAAAARDTASANTARAAACLAMRAASHARAASGASASGSRIPVVPVGSVVARVSSAFLPPRRCGAARPPVSGQPACRAARACSSETRPLSTETRASSVVLSATRDAGGVQGIWAPKLLRTVQHVALIPSNTAPSVAIGCTSGAVGTPASATLNVNLAIRDNAATLIDIARVLLLSYDLDYTWNGETTSSTSTSSDQNIYQNGRSSESTSTGMSDLAGAHATDYADYTNAEQTRMRLFNLLSPLQVRARTLACCL
jgi:hypothetical protein